MYDSVYSANSKMTKDLFPTEAWELISQNRKSDDIVIIDVSTPRQFAALHLPGAKNVNLFSRFFKARMNIMDKSKTYVLYCKVGVRSRIAKKMMMKLGFQKIYSITGGTLLWEEEGLPFASGANSVNRFSLCPMFISVLAFRKIKKAWNGMRSLIARYRSVPDSTEQES